MRKERTQVSLMFDTDSELEIFDEVVIPLKENRQLRQTIIELLGLLKDRPAEIEALLNGENLMAQDDYAKDFLEQARMLERKLQATDLALNSRYNQLSNSSVDDLLSGLASDRGTQTGVQPTLNGVEPQPKQDLPPDVVTSDQLNSFKDELSNTILNSVQDMLSNLQLSPPVQQPVQQQPVTAPPVQPVEQPVQQPVQQQPVTAPPVQPVEQPVQQPVQQKPVPTEPQTEALDPELEALKKQMETPPPTDGGFRIIEDMDIAMGLDTGNAQPKQQKVLTEVEDEDFDEEELMNSIFEAAEKSLA